MNCVQNQMYHFNVFFRGLSKFLHLRSYFSPKIFSDGKLSVLVILPTANLRVFLLWNPFSLIYGRDSGLKKWLNWIFVVLFKTFHLFVFAKKKRFFFQPWLRPKTSIGKIPTVDWLGFGFSRPYIVMIYFLNNAKCLQSPLFCHLSHQMYSWGAFETCVVLAEVKDCDVSLDQFFRIQQIPKWPRNFCWKTSGLNSIFPCA